MDDGSLRLPFDDPDAPSRRDARARIAATDPRLNVVLEASAGTGKTTVLVNRYLNLLKAGVDPTNILAITFTRKAAAEMRQRIVLELRKAAMLSAADAARWRDLRDRPGDIAIATIDAFCLSLLREFPLEADLDPGFDIADETLVARITQDAVDRTLAICRRVATRDEAIRLLLVMLGESKVRRALARLLERRLVARGILKRFVPRTPMSPGALVSATTNRLAAVLQAIPGGVPAFIEDGPRRNARFQLVAHDVRCFAAAGTDPDAGPAIASNAPAFRAALDGLHDYFLTRTGEPRKKLPSTYDRCDFDSPEAYRRHVQALVHAAPALRAAIESFTGELNLILSAGVKRAFGIARQQFRRQMNANAVLDFSEVLARTLALLARMDEFSQSRYRLESRYHHVLVDEFQDTSRAQWRLVSLLVKSWGEGAGLAGGALPPSIFVVGDRKQSIYGFRDAEAAILRVARRDIAALRPQRRVRRAISRSFRSAPALLSFVNDLFAGVEPGSGPNGFRYRGRDAFPVDAARAEGDVRVGLVLGDANDACAAGVADEIVRLLAGGATVRDPRTGTPRRAEPGDVAILFRSREGHQEYERALAARGVAAYVYKGLGFFEADETRDVLALIDYLARPDSDLAAAAFLRSRLVRLSDCALQRLAPGLAAALLAPSRDAVPPLDPEDLRVLDRVRASISAWLPLVDRVPPAEIVDRVLGESAYAYELRGPRRAQARENLKKMRSLLRKIQNRGYATMADVADHLRVLSAGDESNAAIDAVAAVNLMTVHAAKGLEFPIVFLVNLSRGTGGGRDPIRVVRNEGRVSVSIGEFTSEADAAAGVRELEETKRLLYVAVTRARDHLYFCSTVKERRFRPHPRSLGAVLPPSFAALFNRDAPPERWREQWQAPSGRTHDIDVCPAGRMSGALGCIVAGNTSTPASHRDAFEPVEFGDIHRAAVTARVEMESRDDETTPRPSIRLKADLDQPLLGVLVHRLFQYCPAGKPDVSTEDLVKRAHTLMSAADRAAGVAEGAAEHDEETLASRAADTVRAILSDPGLRALAGDGKKWLHEVPFSMVRDGALLRGVIDLLVESADRVTIVEIKTGAARPEHSLQIDVYRAAAEQMFPGRQIEARLIYPRAEP